MVDLVNIMCKNCGFEQVLLIGTSDPDQVYNDLNDDFNYHKVFYCPAHHAFVNLETFNQTLGQTQAYNHVRNRCPADAGCMSLIELEDMVKFAQDFPCPRCGTPSSIKVATKEMLED